MQNNRNEERFSTPVWPENIDEMEFGDDFEPEAMPEMDLEPALEPDPELITEPERMTEAEPEQPEGKAKMPIGEFFRKYRVLLAAGAVGALCICVALYLLLWPKIGTGRHFLLSLNLDLSEQQITTTEGIEKWPFLRKLDLRGNPISETEIMELAEEMPKCRIYFDISLDGVPYDAESTRITVTGMSQEDLDKLVYFHALESIDARGHEMDVVDELIAKYPESHVEWDIEICGQRFDYDSREISTEAATAEDIRRIERLTMLERVGIFGSSEYEAIFAYRAAHPDVEMEWDVDICGKRYRSDTTEAVIGAASAEDVKRLVYLPVLSQVDARGCREYQTLTEMEDSMPGCQFFWTVKVGNLEVENSAEIIDFKRAKVKNIDELSKDFENLQYLPELKKIDMCGCGVKNKQMAAWRDQYPQYKFIWEVKIGTPPFSWTVRTDAKVFSTLLAEVNYGGSSKVFEDLFLYCTDLVALDLGHNMMFDISGISNLKKLQGVILTGNPIVDTSPLAECPELMFAELNGTQIWNTEHLAKCKKLQHLDLFSTQISNTSLEKLYGCHNLKYLVTHQNDKVSEAAEKKFAKEHPNCTVIMKFDKASRDARNNPIRSEFKLAFKNWKLVVDFVDYQHVTYQPGVELKVPWGYIGTTPKEHLAKTQTETQ